MNSGRRAGRGALGPKERADAAVALTTWANLNAWLSRAGSSAQCQALLAMERAGAARPTFERRILSRYARLRRAEDRAQLEESRAT